MKLPKSLAGIPSDISNGEGNRVFDWLPFGTAENSNQHGNAKGEHEKREGEGIFQFLRPAAVDTLPLGGQRHRSHDIHQKIGIYATN